MTTREVSDRRPTSSKGPGAGATVASEFVKLTSLPSQRALLLTAVGLAAFMAAVFYISLPVTQGRELGDLQPDEILSAGILGVDAAAFVMIVLAAIHVGSEYSTGMIQPTLTITPARGRVLAGKFVTVGVASLIVGALAAVLCVSAALIVAGMLGTDTSLILTGSGIQLALGSIAMPVLYSLIAVSAAFVFRSIALGIVVPLAVMAMGGIASWFGDSVSALLTPVTPVAAIHSLSGVATGHESIGIVGAVISLLGWLAIGVGAATWRLLRSDA